MMKKYAFLFTAIFALCCGFGLAACGEKVSVESILLDKTELSLTVGEEATLVATVLPENEEIAVVWTSDNSNVATVDNGKIKAVSDGNTIVTATAGEKSAICSVTVQTEVSYTVTQTQWKSIVSTLTNPLPHKEQNFTVRGEIKAVGWNRESKEWDTEIQEETDEFRVDGGKYHWHLSIGGEYEDNIYERWTEQNGYYLETRYDYWEGKWEVDREYLSEVPCEIGRAHV